TPFFTHAALNCSVWWLVIFPTGKCPKKGIRVEFSTYLFERCSECLLLGTTYSACHFSANSAKVCSCSAFLLMSSMDSPRASFGRSIASYACAPVREFSGLRFLNRMWLALRSTHHDSLIFRTAIHYLVDRSDPTRLQIGDDIAPIDVRRQMI